MVSDKAAEAVARSAGTRAMVAPVLIARLTPESDVSVPFNRPELICPIALLTSSTWGIISF